MGFDLNGYLHRIGCHTPPPQTVAGLFQLHAAQFFTIPFENLDIQLGRPIDLNQVFLVKKIIYGGRGGYCFELNALLLMALRALGFEARALLGRVHLGDVPSGRTHQICCVQLANDTWILDVGFGGGGPRVPLLLQEKTMIRCGDVAYRFCKDLQWGWVLETWADAHWKASYSFDLLHVSDKDIQLSNFFTSHSPDSHFTQIRTVSLPTKDGRLSLRNQTLTRVANGKKTWQILPEGQAYLESLEQVFGIYLDASFDEFRALEPT